MARREVDSNDETQTAPSRGVGTLLREARQRRGWDIPGCAAQLRIRAAVLEAMEAGRFEKLPNGAYALGFVRSYADFLGLDRDEIARRVKAEAAALSAPTELVFPTPLAESRLPSGVILMVSAVLAIGAYGLWYYQTAAERTPMPRVAAVPETVLPTQPPGANPTQAEAATVAAKPAPAPAEATRPERTAVATAAPAPAPAVPVSPAAEAPPTSVAALPSSAPSAAPPSEPAAPPRQYGETTDARIVIKATGDSWVQVRERGGNIVFSRILRAGESFAAPNQSGQLLATGSAGVLDIYVDGKKAPAIGRPGFIRRDVVLDPDRLLAGTAVPPDPPRPANAGETPASPSATERPSGG